MVRACLIALFVVWASAASADPITAFVATTLAVSSATAATILNLAVGLVLTAASRLFYKTPKAPDLVRDLGRAVTLPPYRFVYGHYRVTGTPAPWRVSGNILVGCLILNSRPSQGNFTLFLDDREVSLTGDAFDFTASGGATATNAPFSGHLTCWFGLGDQTTPPADITTEFPDLFETTDGWEGRTVVWLRLDVGDNGSRSERWPRTPPDVEVEGDWSLVYDPRELLHDLADPDTWEFSRNQALIALDALTQNPLRAYRQANLMMATFEDAADVCDQAVALNAGGTEPRYRCDGVIIWSENELEDQVDPILRAGAARFTRASGRLGLIPGAYETPGYTMTDVLEPGIEYTALKRSRDLPTTVRASYVSADRDYESAALEPWDIPGALAADGGIQVTVEMPFEMVTSPTQAMRLRKILGHRARRQKRLKLVALPAAFDLIGGATVTVNLPSPRAALNGVYEVEETHPGLSPVGDADGVALRIPMVLGEESAAWYAWDETTEEEEIVEEAYSATRSGVADPGAITATTGSSVNLDTGGTIIPRVLYTFDPSASDVADYEWQGRVTGGSYGETSGLIDGGVRDGSGDVFTYVNGAAGVDQDFRVRAIGVNGDFSDWVEYSAATPTVAQTLAVPTIGTLTESPAGTVNVPVTIPNDANATGVEVYAGPDSDVNNASLLGARYAGPSAEVTLKDTGLGSGVTVYYFARTLGAYSNESAWSAGSSITTA